MREEPERHAPNPPTMHRRTRERGRERGPVLHERRHGNDAQALARREHRPEQPRRTLDREPNPAKVGTQFRTVTGPNPNPKVKRAGLPRLLDNGHDDPGAIRSGDRRPRQLLDAGDGFHARIVTCVRYLCQLEIQSLFRQNFQYERT